MSVNAAGAPQQHNVKLTVHEDVDEEDLHGVQGVAQAEEGGEGDQRQRRTRRAELEGQEVLNVVEDGFAFTHIISQSHKNFERRGVPSSTAGRMVVKLSSTRIMSAASFATSVPLLPIETPMSAIFSAGASFTVKHAFIST